MAESEAREAAYREWVLVGGWDPRVPAKLFRPTWDAAWAACEAQTQAEHDTVQQLLLTACQQFTDQDFGAAELSVWQALAALGLVRDST